jgi:hypothetical protein
MSNMIRLIFCLLFLSFSSLADEFSPELLVGVWGNSDDGGKTFWAYDEYTADGKILSWGEIPEANINFKIKTIYNLKKEEGTYFNCLKIVSTSHPEMLPVGEKWCSTMVKIDSKEFHFVNKQGKYRVLYRQ